MSPIAPPYPPNSGLVAQAWIGQRVAGVTPDIVASDLPQDTTKWAAEGFVQVTIIPGSPDIDTGVRRPLVQIDCWANSPASVRPPIGKAWRLAETVFAAMKTGTQVFGRPVTLPAGYDPVRVLSVYPQTEPNEVPDDPSGYARVTFDASLDWARI